MDAYRNISPSFWTDPKVSEAFTPAERYFYLYLLTNLHTNLCGCYEITMGQMAKESGLSRDLIPKLIDSLQNKHKVIIFDKDTNEVFIPKWGRYNWCNSIKTMNGALRNAGFIKSDILKRSVICNIDTLFSRKNTLSSTEDTSVLYCTVDSNTNLDDIDTKDTEKDLEEVSSTKSIETSKSKGSSSSPHETQRKKYEDSQEFKAFWDAYPKHQNKQAARTAFERVDVPIQTLLDAIEEQKRSKQWLKDDGQFIPLPSTWLNGKRWEDSMKVDVPKSDGMERYKNLQRLAEEFDDE